MKALYKVDDILFLKSYNDFVEHIAIRKTYWNSLTGIPLKVKSVDISSFTGEVYYAFQGVSFGWAERFLQAQDFLSDKDFEI